MNPRPATALLPTREQNFASARRVAVNPCLVRGLHRGRAGPALARAFRALRHGRPRPRGCEGYGFTDGQVVVGEYDLVDQFGTELRLRSWFDWRRDTGEPAPVQPPTGSTNPTLLALKSPAAVFYFLDILKRFDSLDAEVIGRVGAEAAMAGKTGLNYASPDKTYTVPSYGPEPLSGLEVMCVMYAAFQRVAP